MSHKLYLIFIFLITSGPLFSEMTPLYSMIKKINISQVLIYILEDPTNNLTIHDITNLSGSASLKKVKKLSLTLVHPLVLGQFKIL